MRLWAEIPDTYYGISVPISVFDEANSVIKNTRITQARATCLDNSRNNLRFYKYAGMLLVSSRYRVDVVRP